MKICEFADRLDFSGKLVDVSGSASLLLTVAKDAYIGVPILLNGADGLAEKPGKPGPGGFTGGMVGERGQGPGGGLSAPPKVALDMEQLVQDQPLTRGAIRRLKDFQVDRRK